MLDGILPGQRKPQVAAGDVGGAIDPRLNVAGSGDPTAVLDVYSAAAATTAQPTSGTAPSPDDWSNQLQSQGGWYPFLKPGAVSWTKFTVLTSAPDEVLFQNANRHEFHYEFAHAFIPQFQNMTREQFDEVSLGGSSAGRQAILGAVLTGGGSGEFGLQLVSKEPLEKEAVLALLEAVKKNIQVEPGARFFYFPTAEQRQAAAGYADALAEAGFPVSSPDRWVQGDQVYAPGWAVGRLKFVPFADIDAAYARGELRPTDVLLTDGVPAEVPQVAGIISLASATPNSHVAILAQSYGVPFAYARDEALHKRLEALDGQTVRVQAREDGGRLRVDALGELEPAFEASLLELKRPPPANVPAKRRLGKLGLSVDELPRDAIRFVGGKAANYGVLRKALPEEHVSKAVAFAFDLWDEVMALKVDSTEHAGQQVALGEEIAHRLRPYQSYPVTDLAGLAATLESIRELVRGVTLPQSLSEGIHGVLLGPSGLANPTFDPNRTLRFRSSSNAEDTETTGAGLYDSFSGRLAEDLGLPGAGGERGATEALLRTLASFYNQNAYLERRRRGMNESDTGMAVLVHESYPDEQERANGVATMLLAGGWEQTRLVTQVGADSITNPDPGAPQAEVVKLSREHRARAKADAFRDQESTHPDLRLSEFVLRFPEDYEKLGELFGKAATAFVKARGLEEPVKLDLEVKKVSADPGAPPGERLVVKQIRAVPILDGKVPTAIPAQTVELQVAQTETGDVFSNHLQKCRWSVTTADRWLGGPTADWAEPLLATVEVEYVEDGQRKKASGRLADFAGHGHEAGPANGPYRNATERFDGLLGRNELSLTLPTEHTAEEGPLVALDEANLAWSAELAKPSWSLEKEWTNTGATLVQKALTRASVTLQPPPEPEERVQDRWTFEVPGAGLRGADVSIHPTFRYAKTDPGLIIKTSPLGRWEKTTLRGLTTDPIVLEDDFSQTMRPGHHNFYEEFIFEPRLEPGLPAQSLAELEQQDIRRLYVDPEGKVFVSGKDEKWRELA